jgi:hypothetical protein
VRFCQRYDALWVTLPWAERGRVSSDAFTERQKIGPKVSPHYRTSILYNLRYERSCPAWRCSSAAVKLTDPALSSSAVAAG